MVRRSQEFYDAISNIPKATGGRERPEPHTEIKASVEELVQASAKQIDKTPLPPKTKEAQPKNTAHQQEHAVPQKNLATDSTKTRDLVREKIGYSAEERFDTAVRAIELRYTEKASPFQKTLADFVSFAETDPLTFYAVQPHIERLTTSIRGFETLKHYEIERARADYFFERESAHKSEGDALERVEQIAEKFDQKIHTINSLYEKKIARILSELQPFFPDSTAIKQRFADEFNSFFDKLKQPEHHQTPEVADHLIHTIFDALERTSRDLNTFHKPKGFPDNNALFEATIHSLENELTQTTKQRDQELGRATAEFIHALDVFHLEDASPTQAAIRKIEERYQHDTAAIHARIERLTAESRKNPLTAKDNQARIIGLEKLLISMAKLRDREIHDELELHETRPSQKTIGYQANSTHDISHATRTKNTTRSAA